jgi:GT2 family glycosyltransferase
MTRADAEWSVIVLSWNGKRDTLACLDSLRALERDDVRVVCVDNGSTDGSIEAIRERFPELDLIENGRNLGYAGGNNVGIRSALDAGAAWVVLLNNDATLARDTIDAFERAAAEHPRAGILSGKVLFQQPPDRIWFAGQRFNATLGYSGRPRGYGRPDGPAYSRTVPTERAAGALMAVSRRAIDTVGLLDEELFAYIEDVDWSLRAREAGFEVLFVPDARAWHAVGGSTGGEYGSTHTLYYGVRNMVVVCERHRPLGRVGTLLRRAAILATYLALVPPRRPWRRSLAAVLQGFRDARAGRMGERR